MVDMQLVTRMFKPERNISVLEENIHYWWCSAGDCYLLDVSRMPLLYSKFSNLVCRHLVDLLDRRLAH